MNHSAACPGLLASPQYVPEEPQLLISELCSIIPASLDTAQESLSMMKPSPCSAGIMLNMLCYISPGYRDLLEK